MDIFDLFGEPLLETTADVNLYMLSREVTPIFPGSTALSEFENGLTLGQEMKSLRRDLFRLEGGWKPSARDLMNSPLLKEWGILDAGEVLPRIVGELIGASAVGARFAEGQQIATLQILAIDKEFGWARDRRGFYRLDCDPAGEA